MIDYLKNKYNKQNKLYNKLIKIFAYSCMSIFLVGLIGVAINQLAISAISVGSLVVLGIPSAIALESLKQRNDELKFEINLKEIQNTRYEIMEYISNEKNNLEYAKDVDSQQKNHAKTTDLEK